jgi:hypothetical protein
MRLRNIFGQECKETSLDPKTHFLFFYIFCNSYAYILFFYSGEISGEFIRSGIDLVTMTVLYTLIILGYLAIFYLYRVIDGFWARCRKGNRVWNPSLRTEFVDVFVFALQLILLYFVVIEGAFTAGKQSPEGLIAIFAKLFVPDGIFLAYYAKYRSSKWFLPIAFVWALSMLLRGWGGALFIIAVAEYGWFIYTKKNLKKLLVLFLVLLILSPYVYSLRQIIRGQEALMSGAGILGLVAMMSEESIRDTAASSGSGMIESVILRFQHLDAVYVVNEHSSEIADQVDAGSINSFYGSIPLFGLLTRENGVDITKYISKFADADGEWYIHTGLLGWIIVAPEQVIFFILFIALSIFFLLFFLNLDGRATIFTSYLGFIVCLIYLVFGWYSVFFAVMQGAFLIFVINNFIKMIKRAAR